MEEKLRRRLRSALSHVGLLMLVIIYNLIGTFAFRAFEKSNENTRIADLLEAHDYLKDTLELTKNRIRFWKAYQGGSIVDVQGFHDILSEYQEQVKFVREQFDYPGNANDMDNKWSIPSSYLFCVSALTLIGFGHVAPTSSNGRFFLLVWSIFGIVLTSLYLAVVANAIMNIWSFVYRRICCYACDKRRTGTHLQRVQLQPFDASVDDDDDVTGQIKRAKLPASFSTLFVCIYLGLGTMLYHLTEKWTWSASLYFVFTTLSTIGFGDLVPGWTDVKTFQGQLSLLASSAYVIFGMGVVTAFFATLIDSLRRTAERANQDADDELEDALDGDSDDGGGEDQITAGKFGHNRKF